MISANRLPPTFLNMRLGTRVARLGSPVPRYMSRKPSLSKSPKLLPIVAKTMSSPASLVTSSKPLPVQVAKEPVGMPAVRLAQQALDHVVERAVVAGGEDVEPAVVVVVPGPAREAVVGPVDAHRRGDVGEGAVAIVVIEPAVAVQVVEEQVGIAVVVVVDPGAALAEACRLALHAGLGGDLLERAVALVVIETVGLLLAADEQVEPAVVVVIGPGRGVGIDRVQQPGLLGDVGEAARRRCCASRRRPDRPGEPGPARDEDVQAAVVVVVGLIADQPAELVGHAGLLACGPRTCRPPCCGRTPSAGSGRTR